VATVNAPSNRTAAGDGSATEVLQPMGRVEDALALAERGWAVFPGMLTDDVPPKKVPIGDLVEHGFKDATRNAKRIAMWWRVRPDAHIGVAMPTNTVALDVDDVAVFDRLGLELLDGPGQQTPRGGYHRFFKTDGRFVKQSVKTEFPGADTRVGGRGYVFAWQPSAFPDVSMLPDAPAWLYGGPMVRQDDGPRTVPSSEAGVGLEAGKLYLARGSRDNGLTSLAGSLVSRGATWQSTAYALGLVIAAGGVEQPRGDRITEADLRRIARSVAAMEESKTRLIRQLSIPLSEIPAEEPRPLRLDRLDPDDHTVLFGDGGTGKGIVAAWWAARLSIEGEAVLILDYEAHARYEWRPRVAAFGGDLDRVRILQPTEPIWDLADSIVDEVERVGATWLFVDSVGYACMGLEVEKSATAVRYSAAIAQIRLPTLSLAHTTKADADPAHPFGSVFWSNGARVTIGMTGRDDKPRILTNKKTNQRAAFPPVAIDWEWVETGLPHRLIERPLYDTIGDRAFVALGADGSMTVEDLTGAINADGGKPATQEGVKKALGRDTARFRGDGGKPQRWSRFLRLRRVPIGGAE
jgi:hypothetical protein